MFSYYARKFDTRYHHPATKMATSQLEISSRPSFRNVLGDPREDLWEREHSRHKKTPKGADNWARAREMVFETDASPTHDSDNSRENRKIGAVSSLVQKWRDFEAESKNSNVNKESKNSNVNNNNNNNISSPCSSRSNASSIFSDSSTITDVLHASNSDVSTEYERKRVADIVRRLTSVNGEECYGRDQNGGKDSLLRIRTSCDQSPRKKSAGKIAPPRIRGRHALNEILMHMERDRYREIQKVGDCKAVSNFAHRNRIQKLLRLRLSRQESDAKDGSKSNLTVSGIKEPSKGSGIMHLRDKFNTECIVAETSPRKEHRAWKSSAFNPTKEVVDHTVNNAKKLTISTQPKGKTHRQEIAQSGSHPDTNAVADIQEVDTCYDNVTPSHQNTSQVQKVDKEVGPGSGVPWKKTSYDIKTFDLKELADKAAAASLKRFKENNAEQSFASLHDWIKESGPEWTSEIPQSQSEWEDDEALNYEQETYQDWICDVARPRSDWEDLRQERYQEMLDPYSKNGDIKQLLERRSVSNFLTSEMRDKIDQIMISRSEAKPKLIANRVEQKLGDEKMGYEHQMVCKKIEEEENKTPIGLTEAAECFEQTPSSVCSVSPSVQYRSWAPNAIHSPTDESVSSPSLEQSPNSNSSTRDNKTSLEMELIYNLKGHVEQIHQELNDLRKALSACISMQQSKSQNVMQTGLPDSYIHLVALEKENESISETPRRGSCCLCFKSEVDSLLYRCGHVCTCLKCAQQLQFDSGKCPICRASVQDVVLVQTRPG